MCSGVRLRDQTFEVGIRLHVRVYNPWLFYWWGLPGELEKEKDEENSRSQGQCAHWLGEEHGGEWSSKMDVIGQAMESIERTVLSSPFP